MAVVTHEMSFATQVVVHGGPREIFHSDKRSRLQQLLQSYLDRNSFWQDTKEVSPV